MGTNVTVSMINKAICATGYFRHRYLIYAHMQLATGNRQAMERILLCCAQITMQSLAKLETPCNCKCELPHLKRVQLPQLPPNGSGLCSPGVLCPPSAHQALRPFPGKLHSI